MCVRDWACASVHAPASTTREVNTTILTTRFRCLGITFPSCSGRLEFVSPPGGARHAGDHRQRATAKVREAAAELRAAAGVGAGAGRPVAPRTSTGKSLGPWG